MYVDWEYYKIFYYVAKYQNFTKAARVLGNIAYKGTSCHFCVGSFFFYFSIDQFSKYTGYNSYIFRDIF